MDEDPAAVALDNAKLCDRILAYVATRRDEQIRRALASGLHEAEVAAALGVGLSGVQEALRGRGIDGRGSEPTSAIS